MRSKKCLLKWMTFILIIGMGSASLFGGTTGKIKGRVIDRLTNEPLLGSDIIIEGTVYGAAADMDGQYIILMVPPGIYTVRARMMGYGSLEVGNVSVSLDKTTQIDFELDSQVIEGQKVTIEAVRPIVQMDLTSTEAVISSDMIAQLPVDRLDDVINLQAGMVDGHMRGGRAGEVMFMIDGFPVNDVYSGEKAFEVENNAVAELQVISGTFNAEYGQAMSGVVNIVTKNGGDEYHGEFSTYFGDYLSNHKDLFYNIDQINPILNFQSSLSGPVPLFNNKLKFFVSGRYYDSEGYLYGKKVFETTDMSDWISGNSDEWKVVAHGQEYPFTEELADSLKNTAKAVSMNPDQRITLQSKFTFNLSNRDNIRYEYLLQRRDYKEYNHNFFLNPDGNYQREKRSYNHRLAWTHVFSGRTFMDVRASQLHTKFRQFVFEDIFSPDYASDYFLEGTGANAFFTGGNEMWHFSRRTETFLAKVDITSQVTNTHLIKLGIEGRYHDLWLHEFYVVPELEERIPPVTTIGNNKYTKNPIELSAFIQDKMEYEDIIVNAGVRFDYFQPDGIIPLNFTNPSLDETEKAETSSQISPRIGIAYPISDKGAIHISYGHFFQIPNFDYLYTNPEFDIYPLQSITSSPPNSQLNSMGNANLKPQKTVIYEIGLQQQLTNEIGLDVTMFYKDIRNLLGTEVYQTLEGIKYGRYINRDYGNVKGITVSFEKRPSGGITANLDYTFQIALGNASDPNSAFLDQQSDPPKQTEKKMVPLNWDRRHQINLSVGFSKPELVNVSVIGKLGTGLPYTPTSQSYQTGVENSARKPLFYTFDFYMFKKYRITGLDVMVFMRIYNLFDRKNENDVFANTGRAGYSLDPLYSGGLRPIGLNQLDEYFIRADYYSAPRLVNVGFTIQF